MFVFLKPTDGMFGIVTNVFVASTLVLAIQTLSALIAAITADWDAEIIVSAFKWSAVVGVLHTVNLVMFYGSMAYLPACIAALAFPAKLAVLTAIRYFRGKIPLSWTQIAGLLITLTVTVLVSAVEAPQRIADVFQPPLSPDTDDTSGAADVPGLLMLTGTVVAGVASIFGTEYIVKDVGLPGPMVMAAISTWAAVTAALAAVISYLHVDTADFQWFQDHMSTEVAVTIIVLAAVVACLESGSVATKVYVVRHTNAVMVLAFQAMSAAPLWCLEAAMFYIPQITTGGRTLTFGTRPTLGSALELPMFAIMIIAVCMLAGIIGDSGSDGEQENGEGGNEEEEEEEEVRPDDEDEKCDNEMNNKA